MICQSSKNIQHSKHLKPKFWPYLHICPYKSQAISAVKEKPNDAEGTSVYLMQRFCFKQLVLMRTYQDRNSHFHIHVSCFGVVVCCHLSFNMIALTWI